MMDQTILKKIFRFDTKHSGRLISRESSWLEFKQSFDWGNRADYAKIMASFANHQGGFIVFGVKDSPRQIVGLQGERFENIDEAQMSAYLNSTFSPATQFQKFVTSIKNKKVGILYVFPSALKPVICSRSEGPLKEGEVYFRYAGRSDRIRYAEMRSIIEQERENLSRKWQLHIERLIKAGPANAAILNLATGSIEGHNGALVIDEQLLPRIKFIQEGVLREQGEPVLKLVGEVVPVPIQQPLNPAPSQIRMTDDPEAIPVRVEEMTILANYPLDYSSLVKEARQRIQGIKINNLFNSRMKTVKTNSQFARTRLLNPNNPGGTKQIFYSRKAIDELARLYS